MTEQHQALMPAEQTPALSFISMGQQLSPFKHSTTQAEVHLQADLILIQTLSKHVLFPEIAALQLVHPRSVPHQQLTAWQGRTKVPSFPP